MITAWGFIWPCNHDLPARKGWRHGRLSGQRMGVDGFDEAILFVARQADNNVKWHGWMVVPGGFSGRRLGGLQPYTNQALGYSLYLPKDYGVTVQSDSQVAIFPQVEAGHPGGAWISVLA